MKICSLFSRPSASCSLSLGPHEEQSRPAKTLAVTENKKPNATGTLLIDRGRLRCEAIAYTFACLILVKTTPSALMSP